VQDDDHDNSQPYECGGGDCDDHDATTRIGSSDVCGDGIDNDCDGIIDDKDDDNDVAIDVACGGDDCDDADPNRHGSLPEQCDAIDADCDIATDDADLDGDGAAALACGGGDCNDSLSNVGVGAPEICDGLDNDCDGVSDGCAQSLPGGFDFADGAGGWSADSGWRAEAGAMHFYGVGDGQFHSMFWEDTTWVAPWMVEVDLSRTAGSEEAALGIQVCRTLSCADGVYAWISEREGFRLQLGRIDGGVRSSPHSWRPTWAGYHGVGVTNRLRLYHSGDWLYASVNGVEVDSMHVDDLNEGHLLIVVEDLSADLEVGMDNVFGAAF